MIGGFPLLAPVESIKGISKAVDIGCGTGVATVQMAIVFPSTTVHGLDISPVPEAVRNLAPSNTFWSAGNILDVEHNSNSNNEVTARIFSQNSLSYAFGRMLFLGINDWSKYFSTVARSMKSGGIVEHQDLDWNFYRIGTSECLAKLGMAPSGSQGCQRRWLVHPGRFGRSTAHARCWA